MMTVPMDNSSAPSARELAEHLYKKNIGLETTLRKFAKSRVPSDPNTWFQIRENYEAIILEDHDFSQNHDIELALWQLHYRRIEEYRALLNAAKSAGSATAQRGRTPPNTDSIKKIRSGFKTFLSESTGFYHDLILKIRSKFGLPLGFFSDGNGSQSSLTKDEKKSAIMKEGLISCHRSLIYLGDLARYKGLYGEGDSVTREYAAASSYYKQAASLCPSSGNPHHQLAILASYAGDELVSIYRYFRSLAADIPFSTARDNLIIAFEKNRQSFSQLPGNSKAVAVKTTLARTTGRGRGRGDARQFSKDSKPEVTPVKERKLSIPEILKAFSIQFVRVNGILFTRTSLETFEEIFSSVKTDLLDLLCSGPDEELNFGQDATENGLFIVRLIAILIFTVHNVNRESDGQSYADILQRTVLLQNAFAAAFEFAGHIIKRCAQLHDAASSFLLPAILVFMEWLACHPDIATGTDVEEKQAGARSFFWNQYVAFLNKLISSGVVSGDGDEDEICFFDMSRYDEGETANRLALWEDFELRGFLPLVQAQLILDFSRKHSYGSDGSVKDRQARVQRIFAAGKALMNVVRIDQKAVYFDPRFKRFVIGMEPPVLEDDMCGGLSDAPNLNATKHASPIESDFNYGMAQSRVHAYADVEDEEEEIVFKPMVGEKHPSLSASNTMPTAYEIIQPEQVSTGGEWATIPMTSSYETIQPAQISPKGEWTNYGQQLSPLSNFQMSTGSHTSPLDATALNFAQQPLLDINLNTPKWIMEQTACLSNGIKNFNINENYRLANHGSQESLSSPQATAFAFSPLVSSSPFDPISRSPGQSKVAETFIPSTLDSIMPSGRTSDGLALKPSLPLATASRKAPVSRPVRHLGPPPGFSNTPPKQLDDSGLESSISGHNPQMDDYSWLDGYHASSTKALGMESLVNYAAQMYHHPASDNGALSFPFPGKQVSTVQTEVINEKWQDFQLFDQHKSNSEQQLQQANFQPPMVPEQHQAQSLWSGYFV